MVVRTRLRSIVVPIVFYLVLGVATGYLVWGASNGAHGLKAAEKDAAEAVALQAQLAALKDERARWERRVTGLRPDSVDRDLLDEEAHVELDRVGKDEVVIFTKPPPRSLGIAARGGPDCGCDAPRCDPADAIPCVFCAPGPQVFCCRAARAMARSTPLVPQFASPCDPESPSMNASPNPPIRSNSFFSAAARRRRSGDRPRDRIRDRPAARRDRAHRLGEHRVARRARGAGFGDDQQICGRLPGQTLLRRLPVRRHCREAGDRARLPFCSTAASPTSSRIPAARPTRACSSP